MNNPINHPTVEYEAPLLPDDFARRVISRAREVRRQRTKRRRITAAAAVLLIAGFPLSLLMRSNYYSPVTSQETFSTAQIPSSTLDADYDQIARADEPAQLSDYIMPSAASVTNFADNYSDALWTDYSSNPLEE